jgi:potassium-transporting ATPase potassium-binding subunit
MLLFHVAGFFILYALMRFQAALPFNPAEHSNVAPDLAFNTAISFITNTNWQNYGGEGMISSEIRSRDSRELLSGRALPSYRRLILRHGATNETRTVATILLPNSVARAGTRHHDYLP